MFKDQPIDIDIFKALVKGKYKIDNYSELYVKIVNYQIDKYGTQLYEFEDVLSRRTGVRRK